MNNQEKIQWLLLELKKLEQLLTSASETGTYSVAFFSRSFDVAHGLLKGLQQLESGQIESLHHMMEEYRAALASAILHENENKPEPENEAPTTQPEPAENPSIPVEQHTTSLADVLEKKSLSDLTKAFNLNDRFYFRKELFGGDEEMMSKVINDLNELSTFEASREYIDALQWNKDNAVVTDFIGRIEKRFR